MNRVNLEVLASRSYSFTGDKGDDISLVESTCRIESGSDTVIGKLNFKGSQALKPGPYTATLKAAEKAGKLFFGLSDFQPAPAYPAK
jgi:hypothetical protein